MKLRYWAAAFCLAFFLSCSNSEPKIEYGFIQLVYYPSETRGGAPVERYSFFVLAQDDDGVDNLGELYLYHDREALRWKLDYADWVLVEEDDKIWIGSRSIAMPEGERLPRGQFRAVLVNKGGEKTEKTFTFDGPLSPRYPYPRFSLSDGEYRIESQYPVNRFIAYNQQGERVQTMDIPGAEGELRDFRLPNSVYSLALWAEDEERRTSALTEAIPIGE